MKTKLTTKNKINQWSRIGTEIEQDILIQLFDYNILQFSKEK